MSARRGEGAVHEDSQNESRRVRALRPARSEHPAGGSALRRACAPRPRLRLRSRPPAPPGGCGHPGSSPRPSALPRTYSGHSAPAFWGRGSSVTSFGRLLALPRQLSPRKPAMPPATHHQSTEAERVPGVLRVTEAQVVQDAAVGWKGVPCA